MSSRSIHIPIPIYPQGRAKGGQGNGPPERHSLAWPSWSRGSLRVQIFYRNLSDFFLLNAGDAFDAATTVG